MKKARLHTLFALILVACAVGQLCGAGPVAATGGPVAIQIDAGHNHTCALLSNRTVQCWGDNGYGQLGNGTKTGSGAPVSVLLKTSASSPSVFAFSSATYSVGEAGPTAQITIERSGSNTGTDTVHFATANGTARAGSDYTAVNQTVSFSPGERSKTVSVPITNDSLVEGNETVSLVLSSPSAGTWLGSPSTATLTIQDNDVAPAVLAFSFAAYSVSEAGPAAQVTIKRTGNTSTAVSVHFATANGTARAGSDYKTVNQTVFFSAGQSSKTVSVPIINDSLVEGAETVQLSLSSPSAGAELGSPHVARLTIVDNDKTTQLSAARLQGPFKGFIDSYRFAWSFRPVCATGPCSVKATIKGLASFSLTRYQATYRGHFMASVYCRSRYRNSSVNIQLTVKKAAQIGTAWRATYWTGTMDPVRLGCHTMAIKGTLK